MGLGQHPSENFLVLNFWRVVCVHGFVHGFAHGFGVRWFLGPGIFVDPVKVAMVMYNPGLMDWGLCMLRHVYICVVTLKVI